MGRRQDAPILVLASSLERGRSILPRGAGGPPLTFLTWESLESEPFSELAFSAVLCESGEDLRARRGLLEILRRAYPDAPLVSFSFHPPGGDQHDGGGGGVDSSLLTDPAFDTHLIAPIDGANLRMVLARESRLRSLSRRHRQAVAQIRDQAEKLDLLVETAKAANSLLEPRQVMQLLMSRVREVIRAESWALTLRVEEADEDTFDVLCGDHSEKLRAYRAQGVEGKEGLAGWVIRNRRPVLIADAFADPRCESADEGASGNGEALSLDQGHRSIVCVPLVSRGKVIGAAELTGPPGETEGRFGEKELDLVRLLMEPAAIMIENAILFKKLEEMSVTDDLTRLYNSRFLNTSLTREIKRARRYRHSVSVIFLDLDGFKTVNDSHGHLAGSRALIEVGQVLAERVRETDVVSRYGGDEFTIVMAQTCPQEAFILAERLRKALEERTFLTSMGLAVKLTASFGIASFPEHGDSCEDLISQSDQAMYRVKERSKNGVELATARSGLIATKA